MLVSPPWAAAARYDVAIWVGRVPDKVNPAGFPSSAGELSFETETRDEPAIDELLCLFDLSGMLHRTD